MLLRRAALQAAMQLNLASPHMLCPVLGPSLQERHWGPGACPEKGNETDEGSGAHFLWWLDYMITVFCSNLSDSVILGISPFSAPNSRIRLLSELSPVISPHFTLPRPCITICCGGHVPQYKFFSPASSQPGKGEHAHVEGPIRLLFSSLEWSLGFCESTLGASLGGCEKEAGKPSLLQDDPSLGFTSAGDAVLSEGHNTSELQETEQCNSPCARFFLLPKSRTTDKKG